MMRKTGIKIFILTKHLNISFPILFFLVIWGYSIAAEATEGTVKSQPICVYTYPANHIHCFVRGPNDRMYHNSWDGSQWKGWLDRGANLVSTPFCLSRFLNHIDCFARGTDNRMIHGIWDQGYWSGWNDLGGELTSSPHCVRATEDSSIDCFAKGNNNQLLHKVWNESALTDWQDLGGTLSTKPLSIYTPLFGVQIFAKNENNQMISKELSGDWKNLGGDLGSAPHCISIFDNRLDCVALQKSPLAAVNDWMIHKKYYNHFGTWYWSEWSKVGGELTSPPHCVYLRTSDTHASGNGDAHCFAKGRNNHLIHITYNYKWYCPPCNYSNSWGEWEDLGGDLKSSPYCIARGSNRIDCFAQNKNNQMAHIWWDGSAWSGWQEAEGKVLPNYAVAYAISEWDGNVCQSCESLEIMPDLTNNWLTGMGSYGWSIGKNYEENVFNTKMADPSRQTWGWDNSEGGINGIGLDTSHAAIIATHGSSTSDKGWCGTMHTDVGHGTEICAAEMMKIGSSSGGRLRFLHLITCHSIQYEHREKWFDAAEGKIHLITGFHGSPWVGEHHVNDYLGVGFFGFWFGVGNVWVELTYHNNYSYDYFNDTCPISLGFGATPQDADNAAYNEKYSDHWNDQDPIWMTVHYISGCDPENGGELP